MARILRGDVVRAELDPTQGHEQTGRRPLLVLSQDVFNARSGTVIACTLSQGGLCHSGDFLGIARSHGA